MELNRAFFKGVINAAKAEQESLREKKIRQDGVIAFCEMILAKLAEDKGSDAK